MNVSMVLCDFCEVADGKLFIVGAGWRIKALNAPTGVAIIVSVPWTQANVKHRWKLELLTADGYAVTVPGPAGDQPLVFENDFEVGRPPGWPQGMAIDMPIAITLGPFPMQLGTQYEWRFSINDTSEETWRLSFATPSPPPTLQGPGGPIPQLG